MAKKQAKKQDEESLAAALYPSVLTAVQTLALTDEFFVAMVRFWRKCWVDDRCSMKVMDLQLKLLHAIKHLRDEAMKVDPLLADLCEAIVLEKGITVPLVGRPAGLPGGTAEGQA